MNRHTRRWLLRFAGLSGIALVAQAGSCQPNTPAAVVQQIQAVLQGLNSIASQVAGYVGIDPTKVAQIKGYVADANAIAASLISSLSGTANTGFANQFLQAVQSALSVLAGLGIIGGPWGVLAGAIISLLPAIASLLGINLAPRAEPWPSDWPLVSPDVAVHILTGK